MQGYHKKTHESLAQWSARDALVLKWAALHAQNCLPIHERCEHSKGHGGVVKSVARLQEAVKTGEYKFVLRTDIRGYYQHIRKHQLWKQISHYISDTRVTNLIRQYRYYCVNNGSEIHTPQMGIPRGCALSPLLGGSLLYFVDMEFNATKGIYYARYMDMVLTRPESRMVLFMFSFLFAHSAWTLIRKPECTVSCAIQQEDRSHTD